MNTYDLKHHQLSKNEIMVVVPDDLKWDKRTIKILDKLNECGFIVIPSLYMEGMNFTITFKRGCINVYRPTGNIFTLIIDQETDDKMRDKIKCIVDGKFDDNVRFDLYIEEKWGRTFILTDI